MSFAAISAIMDAQVTDRLGDSMVYQPVDTPGVELNIKGFIQHSDEAMAMGGYAAVVPDVEVVVRKADIAVPTKGDMIVLTERNEVMKVHTWLLDESGMWWTLRLKRH